MSLGSLPELSLKPIESWRICLLVPAYKRPEYTARCIESLEKMHKPCYVKFVLWNDGFDEGTMDIFMKSILQDKEVHATEENQGLRNVIRNFFFAPCLLGDYDLLAKIDNDSIVPENYLEIMLAKFRDTNADILSPNVYPSNASYKYGQDDKNNLGYRPSKIVGGLWMMRRKMIEDMEFDHHETTGIKGAFNILYQIIIEKEPKIGWITECVVQDVGHWSGLHPENIKNAEHLRYYQEIGREIAWDL